MQRIYEDDLVAYVLAQQPWKIVRLAAIAEDDATYPLEAELGWHSFTRRRGEACTRAPAAGD
jgi:hypothetical protein